MIDWGRHPHSSWTHKRSRESRILGSQAFAAKLQSFRQEFWSPTTAYDLLIWLFEVSLWKAVKDGRQVSMTSISWLTSGSTREPPLPMFCSVHVLTHHPLTAQTAVTIKPKWLPVTNREGKQNFTRNRLFTVKFLFDRLQYFRNQTWTH